jgi:hypothetical protein
VIKVHMLGVISFFIIKDIFSSESSFKFILEGS